MQVQFDPAAWKLAKAAGVLDVCRLDGFITVTGAGVERANRAGIRSHLDANVLPLCNTELEAAEKAPNKREVAKATFKSFDFDGVTNDLAVAIRGELQSLAWNECNPDSSKNLQRLVGDSGDGRCLLRATFNKAKGPVVFTTTNTDLILAYGYQPLRDVIERARERMSRNVAMFADRHPELIPVLAQLVADTMTQATADAKDAIAALTTGTSS